MPAMQNFATLPAASDLPLAEVAYRHLRQAIVRCEFEPGERLRVEELARRFDISSSPVREALSRLSEQGMVRALDNRGFRVAPITVEGIADLTRVRLLVECEALRDAMEHRSDEWEATIVASAHGLALIEQRLGDAPMALDNDWSLRHRAFHLAIYSSCSSPMLLDLVAELFDGAERYRRYSAAHRKSSRRKHNEHQKLLESVLAGQAAHAVELLGQHIRSTQASVSAALLTMQRDP